jgi:hypothetical protein
MILLQELAQFLRDVFAIHQDRVARIRNYLLGVHRKRDNSGINVR